jgi:hypothetical protein
LGEFSLIGWIFTNWTNFHPLSKFSLFIGRIFVFWAIVYFWQWFENYRSSGNAWAIIFHGTSYVLILTRKLVGRLFQKLIWSPCLTFCSSVCLYSRHFISLSLPLRFSWELCNSWNFLLPQFSFHFYFISILFLHLWPKVESTSCLRCSQTVKVTNNRVAWFFLDTLYQNGGKDTELPLNYTSAMKYTKWQYKIQMARKYTKWQ